MAIPPLVIPVPKTYLRSFSSIPASAAVPSFKGFGMQDVVFAGASQQPLGKGRTVPALAFSAKPETSASRHPRAPQAKRRPSGATMVWPI